MLKFISTLILSLSLFLISCSDPKLSGTVTDIRENALENVKVKIANTSFETLTNSEGKYSLDYVTGEIKLVFTKEKYIGDTLILNIAEKQNYPVENFKMYWVPEEKQIYYLSDTGYVMVSISGVKINTININRFGEKNNYFYTNGAPLVIKNKNELTFLDFTNAELILVKCDEQGTIGSIKTYYTSFYGVQFNKLKDQKKELVPGYFKRIVKLDPGNYAYMKFANNQRIAEGNYPVPIEYCYYFRVAE